MLRKEIFKPKLLAFALVVAFSIRMRHLAWLAAFACLVGTSPSAAQDEFVSTTSHQINVDGGVLKYTAQAGRIPIRSVEADEPRAHIFYVAYRVSSANGVPRPITFLWGGGPSGPAIGVHMTFGPKRVEKGKVVDNPLTLLPVTDMVFVDPVGTGFSRPTKPEYGEEFL